MPVEIVVRRRPSFAVSALRRRVDALLAALRHSESALCLLLCEDDEIRALNAEYRRKDEPTDVLSFEPLARAPTPRGWPRFLGDLVISLETAKRQARAAGHDLFTEVSVLCAHGLLHLCGYDHERGPDDARRMLRRERALLREVGVERDPLTLRGAEGAPREERRAAKRRVPRKRGAK